MPAFSLPDTFKRLIKEKNINVFSMVQYCNTDRSTMYKYINGKRKLKDLSLFQKISEFMRLSPQEHQEFLQSYYISSIGEYAYYCRKNVENFILDFPENLTSLNPPKNSCLPPQDHTQKDLCFSLNSQLKINNYLYWMIQQETLIPHGHLGLLLEPDYDFLFHLLPSMKSAQKPITIEHIFCLNNSEDVTEFRKMQNLFYLEKILPLFFTGLDYIPYYFYDDINAHFYNLNVFPCLILTSRAALMCSSDFKQGIVYMDQEIPDFLWKTFEGIRQKASPLFHTVNSVLEECQELGNMGWELTPSYGIQAEPCLIPYITPDILERVVYPQISGRDALLESIRDFIQASRARIPNPNMHLFHTRRGILHFLETGRLQEIPEDIYSPFSMEDRIQMLESMLDQLPAGTCRMLKGPLENISLDLHLCFTGHSGYILFSNYAKKNIYLILEESSLLSAFMDYASNLDSNYICTQEETARCIHELIEYCRNGFTPPPSRIHNMIIYFNIF